MTREEVAKMMMYFQSAYRGFYEGKNTKEVINVWHDAFKDDDKHYVAIACRNHVVSNKFPPTVADIKEQLKLITETETTDDLWEKLRKAISNSAYNSVEEFDRLPQSVKKFVGSAGALRDLSQTDMGTISTVVKGQFFKNIGAIKERQEVRDGLPLEVKMAIAEAQRKMLEVNND